MKAPLTDREWPWVAAGVALWALFNASALWVML